MSKPRKSTVKRNRDAYKGVQAVIVSNLPGERGTVKSALRDGIWRTPRTPNGESALPLVKMPRVRVS